MFGIPRFPLIYPSLVLVSRRFFDRRDARLRFEFSSFYTSQIQISVSVIVRCVSVVAASKCGTSILYFAFSVVYAIRFREFWIIFGKVYIIIHLKSLPNIVLPSSSKLNKIRIISSVLPIFFCSREVKLVRFSVQSVQSTCESCLVCWCFFLCYFCAVCDCIVLIIIYWPVFGFFQVWFFDPSFRC